jgi:hypothetical protein
MIAKLPILGFTLVTALAGQAVAHEGCPEGAQPPAPSTYRAPPPIQPSYTTVDYRGDGGHRGDGHRGDRGDGHRGDASGDRARVDVDDLRRSDLNRDGRVTLAEALRHGRRDFQRTDRDQNRVLTWREVSRRDIAVEDRNRNGRISYGEYQDAVRRSFARYDDNRDGVLARYELSRPRSAGRWY